LSALQLFLIFLKIGAFTFGGGYAMIPLIESEVVSKGFLSEKNLVDFIAVSESTPGPFAVNISTYVGAEKLGFWGSVLATLGVVLPSFIIILVVAKFLDKFKRNKYVKGCMSGLRPAVVGLIGTAVISVGETVFLKDGVTGASQINASLISSAAIFIIMLVLAQKKVHPILIIILSAIFGLILGFFSLI
jgi:chromate transporter